MYRMKEKINQKRKKYQKAWKERKKVLVKKKKKKYRFEKHVTVNKNTYIQFKRIFDKKKKSNKFIAFWINSDLDKVTNKNKLNVNDNSYSVEINNVQ